MHEHVFKLLIARNYNEILTFLLISMPMMRETGYTALPKKNYFLQTLKLLKETNRKADNNIFDFPTKDE